MKSIYQVVSWVFLPLFMPMYALILVMYVPSNQDYIFNQDCMYLLPIEAKTALLYMFLIFCVVAPGLSFIILYKRKIITTIEMETTKERTIPIIVMFVYCLMLYVLFDVKSGDGKLPKFVYALPLSGALVTAVYFFLNRWKKISIHAAGVGILVGFILAYILLHEEYELWMFALTLIISGLIMTARLYLQKHTFFEVVFGWLIGLIVTFSVNYFY
jgi:membrane-associated phospholipid phosphatase